MVEKENLKFLGCEILKASFETRTGVKGGGCRFFDKNGDFHKRDGNGNETVFSPAKFLVYGRAKNGQKKVTNIFKTIFSFYGNLKKPEKEQIAENITNAIKDSCQIPAVYYEGSNFFWIEKEDFQNLNTYGAIRSKYSEFQEPFDFF